MDPFFWAASLSKLLQQATTIILLVALVLAVIFTSERLFGLNIKGAVDELEERLKRGDPWPITVLLIASLFAIIWLVRGV